MLVPVAGNFDANQVNRRQIPPIPKVLREQDPEKFPPTYIFNVGPMRHEFPPNNRGVRILEACPKNKAYGKPLTLRNIEISPYDLADGAGNMGLHQEDSFEAVKQMLHEGADLALDTADLTWFGVFATQNKKPSAEELAEANRKLSAMMRLRYDKGSDLKLQGSQVQAGDRKLYNEAAETLGVSPLFGVSDHTMDRCLFCQETIVGGAILCKHCGSRQDSDEAKSLKKAKSA